MEVCTYHDQAGYVKGHYMRHVGGATRKTTRSKGLSGKYKCPNCGLVFKNMDRKPHCPVCDYGLCSRVKRGYGVVL